MLFGKVFKNNDIETFKNICILVDEHRSKLTKFELLDLYNYCRLFGDFNTANFFRKMLCIKYVDEQRKRNYLKKKAQHKERNFRK